MSNLKWGLIGCGDISRKRVAPALRDADGSELVSVSRGQAHLAAEFAKEFGAEKHFADWRDQIADPEIDAVYVATPVDLHAEQTIAAAEAGKHVLCEKPMALDAAACDRMIAAAQANGVRLGVAYYRRFYPVIERVKALIADGEIGEPMIVQINAFEKFHREPGEPRSWLLDKVRAGGGPMMDFGSHRIEILINLFGPVRLEESLLDQLLYQRNVEDTALAVFRLRGGALGQINVTHAAAEPQDTLSIFGTKGSLHSPVLNEGLLRIRTSAGEREEPCPPHPNLHQPLVEDFIAGVREGRDPVVDGAVGREVQHLLDEIYRE